MEKVKIVMVAFGHRQYGALAYNLCASLYRMKNTIPIKIICAKDTTDGFDFSKLATLQYEDTFIFTTNVSKDIGHTKLSLILKEAVNEEPFIFIDIDSFATETYNDMQFISEISNESIWFHSEGIADPQTAHRICHWATVLEMRDYLNQSNNISKNVQSSIMFVKGDRKSIEFLNKAVDVHEELMKSFKKVWYSSIPDELSLAIAGNNMNILPYIASNVVNFHYSGYSVKNPGQLLRTKHITTFPSAEGKLHQTAKMMYDAYVHKNAAFTGLRSYDWIDKTKIKHVNKIRLK